MVATGELSCENCGVRHGPDDIFCENCGYDFITGSLPAGEGPLGIAPNTGDGGRYEAPSTKTNPVVPAAEGGDEAVVGRLEFRISADPTYFATVVSEGELDFPVPPPPETVLELAGTELHIGRTSESRAIHPDLDIAALTGDPAVSSRHAVIRVGPDGSLTVTDVGSTNGTFVGEADSKQIEVGDLIPIDDGVPVFVGAWTRIEVTPLAG